MIGPAPTILLLVGPKGAGKSHLGTLAEARLGARFLRVEPIFQEVQRNSTATGTARDAEGYGRVLEAVAEALAAHDLVVLETTGASPALPLFLEGLRGLGRVRLVAVRAPLDRCLERVRSRDQSVHIPVSDQRVTEINALAAQVELPWDLVLDNGGPAPEAELLAGLRRLL
jgi:shikimate kinase